MENLIKYNPHFVNDLAELCYLEQKKKLQLLSCIVSKEGFLSDLPKGKEHVLREGAYSNYENKIEVYPYQKYIKSCSYY